MNCPKCGNSMSLERSGESRGESSGKLFEKEEFSCGCGAWVSVETPKESE